MVKGYQEHTDEVINEDGEIIDPGKAIATLPTHETPSWITPAQGKVNAVANLTMQAYERASTLKLTPEETTALQADFPDEAFRPGAAGKENLIYLEHAFIRDRLNEVLGIGQWSIVPRSRWTEDFTTNTGKKGVRVYVEGMLVVRGCYVDEAIGDMDYFPSNAATNLGDAVKGAKTQVLRRCAADGLGVGLQAWKKGWVEWWWQRRNQPKARPKQEPKEQTELQKLKDEWKSFLAAEPTVKEINHKLPELFVQPMDIKNEIWKDVVMPIMRNAGYVFNKELKAFELPPQAE